MTFDPSAMSFGALGGQQSQQPVDPISELIKKLLGYAFSSSLGSGASGAFGSASGSGILGGFDGSGGIGGGGSGGGGISPGNPDSGIGHP